MAVVYTNQVMRAHAPCSGAGAPPAGGHHAQTGITHGGHHALNQLIDELIDELIHPDTLITG